MQQSTVAEECVEGSTAPVRRRGLSYRGEARRNVLQGSRGRSRVLYASGGVCGGVHNTRPSGGGGGGATGARPAEVYCKGEGAAAEYCTRAEECVVGSTTPVHRGGGAAELQGRGPRKCTVREQGPQQSTVRERRSVWWGPQHPSVGGGLSYRGEARGSVL